MAVAILRNAVCFGLSLDRCGPDRPVQTRKGNDTFPLRPESRREEEEPDVPFWRRGRKPWPLPEFHRHVQHDTDREEQPVETGSQNSED